MILLKRRNCSIQNVY